MTGVQTCALPISPRSSSGYIAGGTLAGVIFAFMNIPLKDNLDRIEKWATASNPFFEGDWSNLLAMIPFLVLVVLLYMVGREWWLAGRRDTYASPPGPPTFK